jgi:hypothetical protein
MYCFPNRQEAALFERTSDAYEFANTSDKEFESAWVAQRAVADSCSHRPENVVCMPFAGLNDSADHY